MKLTADKLSRTLKQTKYCCIICGKKINKNTLLYGSQKCRKCSRKNHNIKICKCAICQTRRGERKGKNNSNYIDGRTNIKYYCIDCGKEIGNISGIYRSCRCGSCGAKKRKRPISKSKLKYFCIDCNKEIHFTTWFFGKKRCKSCGQIERNKIPQNHPMFIDGRTKKKYYCIDCGKEIYKDTGIYGSGRCGSCSMKIRCSILENHPNWQGGLSFIKYPIEFSPKLKDQIRQRDNHQCQNCGMTEEENLIVVGRVLEVHHIDYNKKNCEETNLISLCKQCHMRSNYNRSYWQEVYVNKITRLYENYGK